MSNYEKIFDGVGDARPLNTWEQNIPTGQHKVALVKYGGKVSGRDKSVFLEAEFIVLVTNNPTVRPGTRYSWPWFINKPDEFGYTHSRAKDFLEKVQKCLGNTEDVKAFGRSLAEDFETDEPQAYGIVLDVNVSLVMAANGTPRRGKKGNEIFNANWQAIAQQDDDIQAARAAIIELATAAATAAPLVMKTEPSVTAVQGPSNGKKLTGMASLLGRAR